jgi:hypothetical protein
MKMFFVFALISVQFVSAQSPQRPLSRGEIVQELFSGAHVSPSLHSVTRQPSMFEESVQGEKKSIGLAVLYSMLLPGMGELYAGEYNSGKYFTIAEGALWITLGSVHWYANWLQNDARNFAVQHAGITQEGRTDQYFIDVGNFGNTYTYNQAVTRSRDYFKVYDPASSFAWQWDSEVNREQYRQLRVSSDEMFNNTRFVAAAIAINHLVSAINAGRLALSHNKSIDEAGLIDIHADVLGSFAHPDGIMISVSRNF